VPFDRRRRRFHHPTIGIPQASAQHRQGGAMSPESSEANGMQALIRRPIHGLAQLTLERMACGDGDRSGPTRQGIGRCGRFRRIRLLHQLHLSPVEGGDCSGIGAAQQRLARATAGAPEHKSENDGSATGKKLRHRDKRTGARLRLGLNFYVAVKAGGGRSEKRSLQ